MPDVPIPNLSSGDNAEGLLRSLRRADEATTENGSGIRFFENQRTQVAVFPYYPSQLESRK
jgi:hypothetical protein